MRCGRYTLEERIGDGGMAEVFRATLHGEAGFARPVAIKRVLGHLSNDPKFAAMFENEARLASLLSHPNIVSVIDFAKDGEGRLFLAMDLVEGRDLLAVMSAGRLPVAVSVFIAIEILRGLGYAHARTNGGTPMRIVHRDVSPHNVLVSWDGNVKVSDFGIAKAFASSGRSATGSVKGKLGYLSPEQAMGKELDGRSDLFAVGIVLHELLADRPLFAGGTDAEVIGRMLHQEVPPLSERHADVSRALSDVCARLLARDRDLRFETAEEAMLALSATDVATRTCHLDLAKVMRDRFRLASDVAARARETALLRSEDIEDLTSATAADTPPPRHERSPLPRAFAILVPGLIVGLALGAAWIESSRQSIAPPAMISVETGARAEPRDAGFADPVMPDAGSASIDAGARPPRPRSAKPGSLSVSVVPWAEVVVDQRLVGTTPIVRLALSAGTHQVTLKNDELGRVETLSVEVGSDQSVSIRRTWD